MPRCTSLRCLCVLCVGMATLCASLQAAEVHQGSSVVVSHDAHTCHTGLSFTEMVAELRARARKGPGHSSNYRGVSLLRATGRWHAQINAAGKQVGMRTQRYRNNTARS